MFRIIRVPPTFNKFFQPLLKRHFRWDYFTYFCLLVVTIAFMWGRNVANLYRHLEAPAHRTRLNNFFLVERWDPEAALRQKAQELLRSLSPGSGDTIYLLIDDSNTAKRVQHMEAVTKMKDPTTDTYIQGHQYVCAILVCRASVIPFGTGFTSRKPSVQPWESPFVRRRSSPTNLSRSSRPRPA